MLGLAFSIAASLLILGVFALGVGCCCCYCTSCSRADDEAAAFEITITGIANSCCAGCSNGNGTFSAPYASFGVGCIANGTIDPAAQFGCCYQYVLSGMGDLMDCSGCPGAGVTSPVIEIRVTMLVSSYAVDTGASDDCQKTVIDVVVTGDRTAGNLDEWMNVGWFEDLADPIISCESSDWTARDIPLGGAVTGSGCDWSSATCTVTRT